MKNVLFLLVLLILTGCVSTKNVPMDTEALQLSEPKIVTGSIREKPDFAAYTAGKAALGLFGVAGIISSGNKLVEEHQIQDPARGISDRIADHLAESLSIRQESANGIVVSSKDLAKISDSYSFADIIVDVETLDWSYIYYPNDWSKYRVTYSAKIRLIDSRSSELVGEGFCSRVPDDIDNAPSRDELVANGAKIVKETLKLAEDYCVSEFIDKVIQ